MAKKTKVKKNDPIAVIKRIAKAMGTKVEFGSQTIAPDNHWCQIKKIFEPSHAFAQEAATSYHIAGRLYIKFLRKGRIHSRIYYMVIPSREQEGYYVLSSDKDINSTLVGYKTVTLKAQTFIKD